MTFPRLFRSVAARPRLLLATAVLVLAAWLLPDALRFTTRCLVAWDIAISVYLVAIIAMIVRSDEAALQRRADAEDAGAATVLALTMLAAVASLAAIGAELHGVREAGREQVEGGRLILAGGTILMSWLFVHTMYALHYAHDYYAGSDDRGGLEFPKDDAPDYWDFLYFAFNLGAAAQTSDVQIVAKRMRRFVLAHTVLSFLFNTTVLALAINVGAGLL